MLNVLYVWGLRWWRRCEISLLIKVGSCCNYMVMFEKECQLAVHISVTGLMIVLFRFVLWSVSGERVGMNVFICLMRSLTCGEKFCLQCFRGRVICVWYVGYASDVFGMYVVYVGVI